MFKFCFRIFGIYDVCFRGKTTPVWKNKIHVWKKKRSSLYQSTKYLIMRLLYDMHLSAVSFIRRRIIGINDPFNIIVFYLREESLLRYETWRCG